MELSNEATTRIAEFLDAGMDNEIVLRWARRNPPIEELAKGIESRIRREIEYHAAPDTMTNALALEGLKMVNWQEIAQLFINEAQEEREYHTPELPFGMVAVFDNTPSQVYEELYPYSF